jgi:hypothetical protein
METRRWQSLWWSDLPESTLKVSRITGEIAADGIYLSHWPAIAVFAPPVCFLFGVVAGATHFWAGQTFTFSLTLMALLTIIASFSAALGAWCWSAYVLGDVVVYQLLHNRHVFLAAVRGAVISYVLLAMLLVFLSLMTRRLRHWIFPYTRFPVIVTAIVQGAVQAALLFIWVHSVPILSRPVYTWLGDSPPVQAMRPLQEQGWILVVIAAICGVARVLVQSYALRDSSVATLDAVMSRRALPASSRPTQPASLLRITLVAAFSTFLLSGLFVSWLDAIVVFAVFVAVNLLRAVISARIPAWTSFALAIPALVRLAAALAVNFALGWLILKMMWQRTDTFRPITAAVLLSSVIFTLAFPAPMAAKKRRRAVTK